MQPRSGAFRAQKQCESRLLYLRCGCVEGGISNKSYYRGQESENKNKCSLAAVFTSCDLVQSSRTSQHECAGKPMRPEETFSIIIIVIILITTPITYPPVLTQAPRNHFYQAEMKKGMRPVLWRELQRQNVNFQGEPPWWIK